MAHGTPKLSICNTCNQYTSSSRFSEYPKCPICNKTSIWTDKEYLMKNYWIPFMEFIYPNFNNWIKLPDKR